MQRYSGVSKTVRAARWSGVVLGLLALASPAKAQQTASIRVTVNVIQVPIRQAVVDTLVGRAVAVADAVTGIDAARRADIADRRGLRVVVSPPVPSLPESEGDVHHPTPRRVTLEYTAI